MRKPPAAVLKNIKPFKGCPNYANDDAGLDSILTCERALKEYGDDGYALSRLQATQANAALDACRKYKLNCSAPPALVTKYPNKFKGCQALAKAGAGMEAAAACGRERWEYKSYIYYKLVAQRKWNLEAYLKGKKLNQPT